jgi:hypothetical protein
MNRIKRRLEQLEHEQHLREISDAEYHYRMTRQLQTELGLPLPDDVPADVLEEGLRRIIAVQAAIRRDRNNPQAVEGFRRWVASIHKRDWGEQ